MIEKKTEGPKPEFAPARLVSHQCENQNDLHQQPRMPGIIENLSSGKCGLQSLLQLFGVLVCRESKNVRPGKILHQYPGLQELYSLWQSLGRPVSGLWRDMKFVSHGAGCSCSVEANDRGERTAD